MCELAVMLSDMHRRPAGQTPRLRCQAGRPQRAQLAVAVLAQSQQQARQAALCSAILRVSWSAQAAGARLRPGLEAGLLCCHCWGADKACLSDDDGDSKWPNTGPCR